MQLPELPDDGWRRAVLNTSLTTLAVCLLAVAANFVVNAVSGQSNTAIDIIGTTVVSITLTIPIVGFLMVKLRQLQLVNEQLHVVATTDFLTGALNRRAFMECVESLLAESEGSSRPVEAALFVVDVDHFKAINDRYGHQTGDIALVRIADTLRASLRPNDLFGRLGGEEFGIYLDDITPVEAVIIAERCRVAINQCGFTPEGEEHGLSVSIGIALTAPGEDFASLFKTADGRLYSAKARGRNRIEPAQLLHAAKRTANLRLRDIGALPRS